MSKSGNGLRDEVDNANVVFKTAPSLVNDETRSINCNEPVAEQMASDGVSRRAVEVLGSPQNTIASDSPADRLVSTVDVTVNPDDQVTLGELITHYTSLLSRGYRATRWVHPHLGVEEQLPSGEWKFSAYHPKNRKGC